MTPCVKCGAPIAPKVIPGGRPKRYCSSRCQRADYCKRMRAAGKMPDKRKGRGDYLKAWKAKNRSPRPLPSSVLCRLCGAGFSPTHHGQAYCSPEHNEIATRKRNWKRKKARMVADPAYADAVRAKVNAAYHAWRVRTEAHGDGMSRAERHGCEAETIDLLAVFERDGWRCQVCGRKTPKALRGTNGDRAPELDHRVPLKQGGSHTYDNVQCACVGATGTREHGAWWGNYRCGRGRRATRVPPQHDPERVNRGSG